MTTHLGAIRVPPQIPGKMSSLGYDLKSLTYDLKTLTVSESAESVINTKGALRRPMTYDSHPIHPSQIGIPNPIRI